MGQVARQIRHAVLLTAQKGHDMRKHTYTHELAPTNTGSITRPARFNLRQTVEVHARTHKLFQETREVLGFRKDTDYATIFEKAILPLCEHALWVMRESPSAFGKMIRSLYDPLPKSDYVRNQYMRLKERFEPVA